MLETFQASVLANLLYPGLVNGSFHVNLVDQRLARPKSWRDLYHYHDKGDLLGWTRYDGQKTTEFNAEGLLVLQKDARGRCLRAQTVRYEQEPQPRPGVNLNPLRMLPGDEIVTYEYDGEQDYKGRVSKREKAEPGK
jgi:hypothetical protein